MSEQKHVSGLPVGPHLSEETHDAIVETRERRKQVAQQAAQKRSGESEQQPETQPEQPQTEG